MKERVFNIWHILGQFLLITAVYILVIQPLAATFLMISQEKSVSVELDLEEDTEKKESQKENKTDEKITAKHISHHTLYPVYFEKSPSNGERWLMSNFDPEIPIPPPKTI